MNKDQIRKIFVESTSSDELFDMFVNSLKLEINEFEHYAPLFSNPVLSVDEIKMFADKLSRVLNNDVSKMYLLVGEVFFDRYLFQDAFEFFQKSFFTESSNYVPLLNILGLYNYDYDDPLNHKVLDFILTNINKVNKKSVVYLELAKVYKKLGDINNFNKYNALSYRAGELEED
ncbi:MAG: hypothetical protein N2321_00300 [Melioribacteraceae bacterium]|nr:hypothetical protein [Melioribacteraceae bacterium]